MVAFAALKPGRYRRLRRTDNEWHHVAVTWRYDSGETQLFFDGKTQVCALSP